MPSLRYLLLQTRNSSDPMRQQEVACFVRALECERRAISVFDLLSGEPPGNLLKFADAILLGGSGHYSVADVASPHFNEGVGNPWLDRALDLLREIHHRAVPTFASCWGFQAMARALGGSVVHDLENAEVGTIELRLTAAGRADPVFGQLPQTFPGQAGHEDRVVKLPPDAIMLASSDRIPEQAYRFADKPIYCTQFHPELDRASLLERVRAYPEYIARIAGISYEDFLVRCRETPESNSLLRNFNSVVLGTFAA